MSSGDSSEFNSCDEADMPIITQFVTVPTIKKDTSTLLGNTEKTNSGRSINMSSDDSFELESCDEAEKTESTESVDAGVITKEDASTLLSHAKKTKSERSINTSSDDSFELESCDEAEKTESTESVDAGVITKEDAPILLSHAKKTKNESSINMSSDDSFELESCDEVEKTESTESVDGGVITKEDASTLLSHAKKTKNERSLNMSLDDSSEYETYDEDESPESSETIVAAATSENTISTLSDNATSSGSTLIEANSVSTFAINNAIYFPMDTDYFHNLFEIGDGGTTSNASSTYIYVPIFADVGDVASIPSDDEFILLDTLEDSFAVNVSLATNPDDTDDSSSDDSDDSDDAPTSQ
ncbi:dentin sialophosphoprotein isoform X4 [Aethina tumida]|uniref:dentin sialophosphoprotein isoform X3 n=1 Tax=Aethina tumida TaxID=116153 RepID=UPI002149690F|nr:dentin sialophosphoprotein isoform X3 [Aethina tumida]XP_049822522.1 dentin sialophosphoprotein isoform X4 [Aethina tumida]